MSYTVKLEKEGALALITIVHEGGLNILDEATLLALEDAAQDVQDDADTRVAIITGAGPTFIAGADIKMMPEIDHALGRRMALLGQRVFGKILFGDKPFIAAVNGIAFGGGMELVLACDLVYASENAQFGQLEVNVGLIPGWGGSQKLARMVGVNKAKEICMFGDPMKVEEARDLGIVNRIFPSDMLMDTVKKVAGKLAGKSPLALKYIKRSCNAALETPLSAGLQMEAELFGSMCASSDQHEGAMAFLEKRAPKYEGQ